VEPDRSAPAYGRKVVLYSTCFVTWNEPGVGRAARAVLARNGVATEIVYPRCCGMPLLEQGRIAERWRTIRAPVSECRASWPAGCERGYDVVALVPFLRADAEVRVAADPAGDEAVGSGWRAATMT